MERINPLQPRSVLTKGEPVGYHSPISHDPTPIFLEQRSNYVGSSHRIRQSRDDARDDYLPKAYGMERETQVHPPIRNHIMVSRSFTTTNRIHHDHEQQSHAARRDSWEAWRKSWHSWRSEGRRYFDDRTREPRPVGGMVPLSNKRASVRVDGTVSFRSQNQQQHEHGSQDSPIVFPAASHQAPPVSHAGYQRAMTKSQIVIPDTIHIPNALKHTDPPNPSLSSKRSLDYREPNHISSNEKRAKVKDTTLESTDDKKFSRLALLCSATIELGPLQENPTGCSCPKSRCIALYCDCFKAGRRCDRSVCTCLNCKNTAAESGPTGARSKVRSVAFHISALNAPANTQGVNCRLSKRFWPATLGLLLILAAQHQSISLLLEKQPATVSVPSA